MINGKNCVNVFTEGNKIYIYDFRLDARKPSTSKPAIKVTYSRNPTWDEKQKIKKAIINSKEKDFNYENLLKEFGLI